MAYYSNKDEYVPKFKIGEIVVVWQGFDTEWRGTITGRRVRRTAAMCDTFYEIIPDNGDADGFETHDGAWEVALSHTTELLTPGDVLARILPMFDAPVYVLTVGPTEFALVLYVSETRRVKLLAMLEGGQVQTLGEWTWQVLRRNATAPNWSVQKGTAANLGGALVDASNTLHGFSTAVAQES